MGLCHVESTFDSIRIPLNAHRERQNQNQQNSLAPFLMTTRYSPLVEKAEDPDLQTQGRLISPFYAYP